LLRRSSQEAAPTTGDVLHHTKQLAELRDAGVLGEAEFQAKKVGLPRRI